MVGGRTPIKVVDEHLAVVGDADSIDTDLLQDHLEEVLLPGILLFIDDKFQGPVPIKNSHEGREQTFKVLKRFHKKLGLGVAFRIDSFRKSIKKCLIEHQIESCLRSVNENRLGVPFHADLEP